MATPFVERPAVALRAVFGSSFCGATRATQRSQVRRARDRRDTIWQKKAPFGSLTVKSSSGVRTGDALKLAN
jgi:hypothetical protein